MIKAIILDIDGIILGHQDGINFPLPTSLIRERLQNLSKRLSVSLCTVKAFFAVMPIVEACGLQQANHITDAGATTINGTTKIDTTCPIATEEADKLINDLRKTDIYTEWYTDKGYYALKHENKLIFESRSKLFGREALLVPNTGDEKICKIIALPLNELQEVEIVELSRKYTNSATLHWGINPSRVPKMAAFFTNPLATKRTGAETISRLNGIPLSETLALGDSTNDWTFMELCGYVGTLNNGTKALKEQILKRKEIGFVSKKSVNEDGLLDVLEHFGL